MAPPAPGELDLPLQADGLVVEAIQAPVGVLEASACPPAGQSWAVISSRTMRSRSAWYCSSQLARKRARITRAREGRGQLVEPLQHLVHALADERLDALRLDGQLQQVAELVGQVSKEERLELAEDPLHGAQYRALHSGFTAPAEMSTRSLGPSLRRRDPGALRRGGRCPLESRYRGLPRLGRGGRLDRAAESLALSRLPARRAAGPRRRAAALPGAPAPARGSGRRSRAAACFVAELPEGRRLAEDVEAALEGDPAARGFGEIVAAYPSIHAIAIYRLALAPPLAAHHVGSRHRHRHHPGARIGRRFFIDHGTGVVVGQTRDRRPRAPRRHPRRVLAAPVRVSRSPDPRRRRHHQPARTPSSAGRR